MALSNSQIKHIERIRTARSQRAATAKKMATQTLPNVSTKSPRRTPIVIVSNASSKRATLGSPSETPLRKLINPHARLTFIVSPTKSKSKSTTMEVATTTTTAVNETTPTFEQRLDEFRVKKVDVAKQLSKYDHDLLTHIRNHGLLGRCHVNQQHHPKNFRIVLQV